MRFYINTEEDSKYMVVYHGTAIAADYYYYRYYRDAKIKFDRLKEYIQGTPKASEGTSISLYDLRKDIRKEFYKL